MILKADAVTRHSSRGAFFSLELYGFDVCMIDVVVEVSYWCYWISS